jgi:hypothetical protein
MSWMIGVAWVGSGGSDLFVFGGLFVYVAAPEYGDWSSAGESTGETEEERNEEFASEADGGARGLRRGKSAS